MPAQGLRLTRFAFVDVETTGIDPASAVVEVAVQVVEGGRVVAAFESLVDPGCPIPRFVTAIHGIDDAMVRGRPRLRQLVPGLVELTAGAVLVAHNAAFDRRFLPFLAHRPSVCSYGLALRVVPEAPNHRNQTLGAFFGVRDAELNGRRPHRALADAIVTRHVFFRCLERYLAAGNPDQLASLQAFVASASERALGVTPPRPAPGGGAPPPHILLSRTPSQGARMPLEIIGMPFYAAPATRIDGFPAAVTSDLGAGNELSDKGTGIGLTKPWSQDELEAVAARAAALVDPARRA